MRRAVVWVVWLRMCGGCVWDEFRAYHENRCQRIEGVRNDVRKDRCDAWTNWMCASDPECGVLDEQDFKRIYDDPAMLSIKDSVMENMTGDLRYSRHDDQCQAIGTAPTRRRLAWGDGDECLNTTAPNNQTIELKSVESLLGTKQVKISFRLNITNMAYRVLVGVAPQDHPFNATNESSWVLEPAECVVPLEQENVNEGSAVLNDECFRSESSSMNATMYVIVYPCGEDVVVSRHATLLTVAHFLRGASGTSHLVFNGFVCILADFKTGVRKQVGDLLVGALDPVFTTTMQRTLKITTFAPFEDQKYRVVVGLNKADCSLLTSERENGTSSAGILRVESDGNWTAACNGTWSSASWKGLVAMDVTPHCYCVLVEESSDRWKNNMNYRVVATIESHSPGLPSTRRRASSLVGHTTMGGFTVRRHAALSDDHHEEKIWVWMLPVNAVTMMVQILIWVYVIRWCRRRAKKKRNGGSVMIGTEVPSLPSLRAPDVLHQRIVRKTANRKSRVSPVGSLIKTENQQCHQE